MLADFVNDGANISDAGVSEGEIGVELDGLLVHLESELEALAAGVAAATQVIVICNGILRWPGSDLLFFLRRKVDAEGLRDAARDFVLHFKDVVHFTIKALSPKSVAGMGFDELCGDAQTIAGTTEAAAENVGSVAVRGRPGER